MARESGKLFTESDIKNDSRFIQKTTLVDGNVCLNNTVVQSKIHVDTSKLPSDGRMPTFDDVVPRPTGWRVQASSSYCVQTAPPLRPTYTLDYLSSNATSVTVRVSGVANGGKYAWQGNNPYGVYKPLPGDTCINSGTVNNSTTFDIVFPLNAGQSSYMHMRMWNVTDSTCGTFTDLSIYLTNPPTPVANITTSAVAALWLWYYWPGITFDNGSLCFRLYDNTDTMVAELYSYKKLTTPNSSYQEIYVGVTVPMNKSVSRWELYYYIAPGIAFSNRSVQWTWGAGQPTDQSPGENFTRSIGNDLTTGQYKMVNGVFTNPFTITSSGNWLSVMLK